MAQTSKGIPLMDLNDVADITQVNKGFNKIDELLTEHENKKIVSEDGVHGFRFNAENEEFEKKNDKGQWESIGGVGSATATLSPVKNIRLTPSKGKINIAWEDPEDNTWAGTKLLYKIGSYPQNPKDGTLVVDNKTKNQYKEQGIDVNALTDGTKYYFMFFPYDTKNKYSLNIENRVTGTPQNFKIMTVKIDQNDPNPETSVTYHDDAVGMTPGSDEWDEFFGYFPCLLKNGKIFKKLNPRDRTKFEDNTPADISTGEAGDVMIAFPRKQFKITTNENNVITISMSDNLEPLEGFQMYAHYLGNELKDFFYIGTYLGSLDGGKLKSLANKNIQSAKYDNSRQYAFNNGRGYGNMGFYQITFIQIMFILKYRKLNSTQIIAPGYNPDEYFSVTGGTEQAPISAGNFKQYKRILLFGIEDFWGAGYAWLDGIYADGQNLKVTQNTSFALSSSESGYLWKNLGNYGNSRSGFLSSVLGSSDTGFLGKNYEGSLTTYYCSHSYYQPVNNEVRLTLFGDRRNETGIFLISLDHDRDSTTAFMRLMYL